MLINLNNMIQWRIQRPFAPSSGGDHKANFVDFYGKMSALLAMQEDPS